MGVYFAPRKPLNRPVRSTLKLWGYGGWSPMSCSDGRFFVTHRYELRMCCVCLTNCCCPRCLSSCLSVLSCPALSCPVLCCPVLFNPFSSCLLLSCPVLSYSGPVPTDQSPSPTDQRMCCVCLTHCCCRCRHRLCKLYVHIVRPHTQKRVELVELVITYPRTCT